MQRGSRVKGRRALVLPVMAIVLASLVVARAVGNGAGAEDVEAGSRGGATAEPAAAAAPTEATGAIQLPATWRIVSRDDGSTTWRSPSGDDAVTLASIEAGAAPLATIVRGVAQAAGDTAGATRELAVEWGGRGDSALLLPLRVPDDAGGTLLVQQVWRRDLRAARDVVATWTSGDTTWEIDPASRIPEADVR